ncbi:hypothetical protein ACPV5R_18705 [Vibrio astriarenae]
MFQENRIKVILRSGKEAERLMKYHSDSPDIHEHPVTATLKSKILAAEGLMLLITTECGRNTNISVSVDAQYISANSGDKLIANNAMIGSLFNIERSGARFKIIEVN